MIQGRKGNGAKGYNGPTTILGSFNVMSETLALFTRWNWLFDFSPFHIDRSSQSIPQTMICGIILNLTSSASYNQCPETCGDRSNSEEYLNVRELVFFWWLTGPYCLYINIWINDEGDENLFRRSFGSIGQKHRPF